MITVVVPGVLQVDAGGSARLSVQAVGRLSAVFEEIALRWPRLARRVCDERGQLRRYVNVYVDGEECRMLSGLETPVKDGAEILVLPSVAGG